MAALIDVDINEYFLQTPINDIVSTVKKLKERNDNAAEDVPFGSDASGHVVKQSERELLEIVSRICKTKSIITDECVKVRHTILQAISAADKSTEEGEAKQVIPHPDWSQSFQTCLDYGDMLTATLLQDRLNGDHIDLRQRLLNQETCLATAISRPKWDMIPMNVIYNCYLSLNLMLPSVSSASILNFLLNERIQVIKRLLKQVEECYSFMPLAQSQALRLSLILSLVTHVESLLNFTEELNSIFIQLLDRTQKLIPLQRHTCQCKARLESFNPEVAHPKFFTNDDAPTLDVPLIFIDGIPSVCHLSCISSVPFPEDLATDLRRLQDQLKEMTGSLLPTHIFDTVNYYNDIHTFYTLVLLLLIEWSDNTLNSEPWKPFRSSLPCLQHALRHCPSISKLKGILETAQDKELFSTLPHPLNIMGIEETINSLRSQYLTSMSSFVSAQTKAELTSDSLRSSSCDRIAHHVFLNFWRSMEHQLHKRSTDILDLIKISDYELKDKLVTSLTEELLSLQTTNMDMYYFHFVWILMRSNTESNASLRQALLAEFLDDFWTEDLRIASGNMSSLQAEVVTIADRLFVHLNPPLEHLTTTSSAWRQEDVIWIIELLVQEILPILTKAWRLPLKSSKSSQQPEGWYDILRLGFLKHIATLLKRQKPNPSSMAFVRALYNTILEEEPQIVETTSLLFKLSLELGQILNELTPLVSPETRAKAEDVASAIITLIQPFAGRDLRLKTRPIDQSAWQMPSVADTQPTFFKKLPIVRRVPLKQPSIVEKTPTTTMNQASNDDASFSLSQLLTVRPTFSSAFGALWDNVISK